MGIFVIITLHTGEIPNAVARSESVQNSNSIKYYPVFFWKGFNIYYPKAVKTAFVSLSPQSTEYYYLKVFIYLIGNK